MDSKHSHTCCARQNRTSWSSTNPPTLLAVLNTKLGAAMRRQKCLESTGSDGEKGVQGWQFQMMDLKHLKPFLVQHSPRVLAT